MSHRTCLGGRRAVRGCGTAATTSTSPASSTPIGPSLAASFAFGPQNHYHLLCFVAVGGAVVVAVVFNQNDESNNVMIKFLIKLKVITFQFH